MNDSACKDAPPINPPSTFGQANNSFELEALQLPPYKIEIESVVGKPQSATEAITEALGHKGYRVLAIAFFVCGTNWVV